MPHKICDIWIFSKEKFIAARGLNSYQQNRNWIDACEGKIVVPQFGADRGIVEGTDFIAYESWCIKIKGERK